MGSYWRAVRTHPMVVAIVTLVTVLMAVAWISFRADTFEAEAQLLVTPLPQADETFLGFGPIRDSGDPTRTVQTAAALIETRRAAVPPAGSVRGGTPSGS